MPSCATIASNDSLTALVKAHYPNASLMPNESAAESSILSIWGAVCNSSAFTTAYDAEPGARFSDSVQILDKNRTSGGVIVGSLFVFLGLAWNASCPTTSGQYPSGFSCAFRDSWVGNLSTGAVSGPAESVVSARLSQCDTPAQNQTDVDAVGEFYPNANQHPNETVALEEVQAIWGELCSSEAYFQILTGHPNASNGGFSVWTGSGVNSSGESDLFVQWSIGWNAECSAGPSCYYAEEWTANLATDSVTGPVLSVSTPSGGPRWLNVSPTSNGPSSPDPLLIGLVLGVGTSAGILTTGVLLATRSRRPD